MSEGPQYTNCVPAADFTSKTVTMAYAALDAIIGGAIGGVLAFLTGIVALPLAALAALVSALRTILDWMVNGKLVCMQRDTMKHCDCGDSGHQICALGQILDTEDVGQDKNPIEDLDNDYAMNLILSPMTVRDFWLARSSVMPGPDGSDLPQDQKPYSAATAPSQPQGDLITKRLDDDHPYSRTVVFNPMYGWKAWTEIIGRDYGWGIRGDDTGAYADFLVANGWDNSTEKFDVPVLHCEFEGSRPKDVLDALNAFTLGGSWCKKNFIFGLVCRVLAAITAPFALAAAAYAWAAADDGNAADALVGGGTISSEDWVIARGRWVWDGGHEGWNEMHATRTVQKVDPDTIPASPAEVEDYLQEWCRKLSEVPRTGSAAQPLTSEQQSVHDRQGRPENQWTAHPLVDGCTPHDDSNGEIPSIH